MDGNRTRGGQRVGRRCGSTGSVYRLLDTNSRPVMAMALVMALCSALRTTTNLDGVTAFGLSSYQCSNNHRNRFPSLRQQHTTSRPITRISFFNNDNNDDEGTTDTNTPASSATANSNSNTVWSPDLRKIMAGVASLGALETGYLTYAKLVNKAAPTLFCGSSQTAASSCDRVLNGPYSNLPFFENVPLAVLGVVAYSSVVFLALQPLVFGGNENENSSDEASVVDDTQNRILLTALTTAMGTFSIFLMTLLFSILRTSCPYCVFSAGDSFLLANLALIGGCLPEGALVESGSEAKRDTSGGRTVAAGFAGAVLGAVLLFGSGSIDALGVPGGGGSSSTTLLATTLSGGNAGNGQEEQLIYLAPEITTESSDRALSIAKNLQQLDAKMYGAHWCSHCFDQKQALGKQVFDKKDGFVEYVECAKDGVNSDFKTCKAKEIPGYPTWEIRGKLYPGEQNLEELEELIQTIRSN